jgi:hypothetical protein
MVAQTTRRVPVLTAADISTLRRWRVLVLRAGMRVTIGRVRPVWKRADVKAAAAADRRESGRAVPAQRAGGSAGRYAEVPAAAELENVG